MYNYHIIYLPRLNGNWDLLNNPTLGFPNQIAVKINYRIV